MIAIGTTPMQNFSELNDSEALLAQGRDLYERCIQLGNPALMLEFLEEQIAQEPPRTSVLRELCDELQQKLMALHETYFEARDRVLYVIRTRFALDLDPLIAPKPDVYHQLPIDDLITSIVQQKPLTLEDESRLRRILKVSHVMAAQVYNDAEITQQIVKPMDDWLRALATQNARRTGEYRAVNTNDLIQ
jgi:hypothetical protein